MSDPTETTAVPASSPLDPLKIRLTVLLKDEAKVTAVMEAATKDGLTDMDAASSATESDWTGWGVPKLTARKLVAELAAANAPAPAPATAAPAAQLAPSLIPQVPSDESFLGNLTIGGVLKPSQNDVLAAIRALNASRYGIFDIEDRMVAAMEQRAEEMEETYPDIYYTVQKSLATKAHAEVLRALGISSRVVSTANVKKFLGKMAEIWAQLAGFYEVVDGYVQNWQAQMGPQTMMAMASMLAGGAGGASPFAQEAPDASPLVDQARGIIDRINKMFAGPGIPVARALAADAQQLTDVLKQPELINAVGAANREEMLKKLGINISADAGRSEKSLLQFALGVLKLSEAETSILPRYILEMRTIGATIPWSTLGARGGNGAGARFPEPRATRGGDKNQTY